MKLEQRINAFVQLGKFLEEFSEKKEWKDYSNGVSQNDFNELNGCIEKLHHYNGWFTEENVRKAIKGIRTWLFENELNSFCKPYTMNKESRNIAIITAGNIPLVGFHDVMCSLLVGHNVILKLSSDDDKLLPLILKYLVQLEPEFYNRIRISDGKLNDYHAVIATGSDNTNRYFETYFGKYPHIFRGNRTSIAVLNGEESEIDLKKLGNDIFDFFGLGCRNVSKVFVPKGYDLNKLFGALFEFKEIVNHNKYGNNYDYNKAILILDQTPYLLENGFLILQKSKELHSPLAVLYYDEYENRGEVDSFLKTHESKIQCVVGKGFVDFGKAQEPKINDFADNVDTMKFLTQL